MLWRYLALVAMLGGACSLLGQARAAPPKTAAPAGSVAATSAPGVLLVPDLPLPGSTLVDLGAFTAHLEGPPSALAAVSRLELRVGGMPVDEVPASFHGASVDGGSVASPAYSVTTSARGLLFDQDTSYYWVARDARGQEAARSPRVPLAVRRLTPRNAPGVLWSYSVLPAAPPEGAVVSGTAVVAAFNAGWGGTIAPATTLSHCVYEYFVDGEMAPPGLNYQQQGLPVAWTLDTTRWPNGVHRVYVQAQLEGASPDVLYYAFSRELDFENGSAPYALVPSLAEVQMAPGTTASLTFRVALADGGWAPVDPATLTVADSDSVNQPVVVASAARPPDGGAAPFWGTLFAPPGPGGATSLVFAAPALGMSATVRVRVAKDPRVPHLARDGRTLRGYDPASSVFVGSYFGSGASYATAQRPDQGAQYRAAGVNAVSQGFYANPADSRVYDAGAEPPGAWASWPGTGTSWAAAFDGYADPGYQWAQDNGLLILATGDDLLRNANEQADTAANPWAGLAVGYALAKAVATGSLVGVEMADEADMVLGGSPPPVAVQALAMLRAVPGHPGVSWPLLGVAQGGAVAAWQGDPAVSDRLTYYWTSYDRRNAYRWGPGIGEAARYAYTQPGFAMYSRWPYVQRTVDRPFFMLTGCGANDAYALWEGHNLALAQEDAAQVMAAAAAGAAGVRVFQLDNAGQKAERAADRAAAAADGGAQWPQTSGVFADPWTVGTDRWGSIGGALRLAEQLAPYLFAARVSAEALPGNFVVGARDTGAARLYLAVNESEARSAQVVDLRPYEPTTPRTVTRYRLKGDGQLVVESVAPDTFDAVVFDAAETIAWVLE